MKKILYILLSLNLLIFFLLPSLTSCQNDIGASELTDTTSKTDINYKNSTSDIKMVDWDFYVWDDTYMIGKSSLLLKPEDRPVLYTPIKYNFKTKKATPVCIDETCENENLSVLANAEQYIGFYKSKIYFAELTGVVIGTIEEGEGHTDILENHTLISSYDLTTGEYENLVDITMSDVQNFLPFIYDNGQLYYLKYISNTSNPKTADDYTLSMCNMNLDTKKETILFDQNDTENIKYTICGLFFIDKGVIYFGDNNIGTMGRINADGTGFKWLLDGNDKYLGVYSEFGAFLCDDYIYFCLFVSDINPEKLVGLNTNYNGMKYIYRININGGTPECIVDDYIRGFYMTNGYIYYILDQLQYTDALYKEANPVKGKEYDVIIRTDHDGSNRKNIGYLKHHAPFIWIANGELYATFGETNMEQSYLYSVRFGLDDGITRNILNDEIVED